MTLQPGEADEGNGSLNFSLIRDSPLSKGQAWKLEIATHFEDDEGRALKPESKNVTEVDSW